MKGAHTLLVLGGAGSGKSAYAESLAEDREGSLVYIATAEAGDDEMRARIAAHTARRGPRWRTVEEPVELVHAIETAAGDDTFVLVDCITLWLSNLLLGGHDVAAHSTGLLDLIGRSEGDLALVSNEVGLGVVPDNALARRFRDEAGALNRKLARAVRRVVLVTAGLPLRLK